MWKFAVEECHIISAVPKQISGLQNVEDFRSQRNSAAGRMELKLFDG